PISPFSSFPNQDFRPPKLKGRIYGRYTLTLRTFKLPYTGLHLRGVPQNPIRSPVTLHYALGRFPPTHSASHEISDYPARKSKAKHPIDNNPDGEYRLP